MLARLLRRLAEQDTRSIPELAQELGVQAPLVHMMLEELTRLGYLRAVDGCAVACSKCATHARCATIDAPKVWAITDKGAKFLREPVSRRSP